MNELECLSESFPNQSIGQFILLNSKNDSDYVFNCISLCDYYEYNYREDSVYFYFNDGTNMIASSSMWRTCWLNPEIRNFKYKEVK